ncbi:MAG: LysR family transcriptional regulator [Magnetospirillum sp.]|nr:LysR family transcriptional regulator [Magnetospirillum sp.]
MRGFDAVQLNTFVAVAEAGSLTAGAGRVYLSQSTVSEQIRKLEEQVGLPLFTRSKAGTALTPAGEMLLDYARRILALGDAAYRDLRGHALEGELRLAVTDYFRPSDMARMLRRLNDSHPRLRLHVAILKSADVLRAEEFGSHDVGVYMRIAEPDAAPAPGDLIRRERLVWVTAAERQADWAPPVPLVILPASCSLHQYTVAQLQRRRVPHVVAHMASGVAGVQLALAAGLGVACLNESSVCPGLVPVAKDLGLPELPPVEFRLLPPRPGEAAFVSRARAVLAAELA